MKLISFSLLVGLLVGQCLLASGQTIDKQDESPAVALVPNNIEQLRGLESSIQKSIETALPAVVAIGNRFGRKDPAAISLQGKRFASGVIISEDGLVLSQYHVTHQGAYDKSVGLHVHGEIGDKVEVVLADGRRVTGELLGADRLADISLVKIVEPGPYACLKLNAATQKLGAWSIKLGHPQGYRPARGVSARLGRIAYVNELDLVSSCSIDGGDSGGPLVNLAAEIVGQINDSYMPPQVYEVAKARGAPMSFMTTARIDQFLEPMRTKITSDTLFRNHSERTTQFEKVTETARPELCDVDLGVSSAYLPAIGKCRESVVEILGADKSRISYGTIISPQGFLVTLASRVKDYPVCRLRDGSTTTAQIIGKDEASDLALLKISMPTPSVQWASEGEMRRGTFLVAPTRDDQWGLGILCAPAHANGHGFFTPVDQPDNLQERVWPMVFEHDVPLDAHSAGGPVFNLSGQIVGITIARAGLHASLAVPMEHVRAVVDQLQLSKSK